jgi:WD40 repeat protein
LARVFFSYAHNDIAVAQRLANALVAAGHTAFVAGDSSRGIALGASWPPQLEKELRDCHAVVALVGQAFAESHWCRTELERAAFYRKPVLPVQLESGVVAAVIGAGVQYADGMGTPNEIVGQILRSFWEASPPTSVFPGLRPFTRELAGAFHGRRTEIKEAVRAVYGLGQGSGGILAIVGPSGCGKSSFLQAGLVPAIAKEPGWRVLPLWTPGPDPVGSLVDAVLGSHPQGVGVSGLERVRHQVAHGDLTTLIERLLHEQDHEVSRIMLPVDQAEELLTAEHPSGTPLLVEMLKAAPGIRLHVVAALRSVYQDDLIRAAAAAARRPEIFGLLPLGPAALRQVIEQPAKNAGLVLEEGLVDRLVAETESGEALALLAFTLRELAADAAAADGRLTLERYEVRGGVQGALTKHAGEALGRATTSCRLTESEVLDRLMTLVEVDNGRLVRRRLPMPKTDAFDPAFVAFLEARLIVVGGDPPDQWVTLVHEKLLTAWEPLRERVLAELEVLRLVDRIERAAMEWHDAGTTAVSDQYLWRGSRLEAAEAAAVRDRLGPRAAMFLAAARAKAEDDKSQVAAHERRTQRLRRVRDTALVLLLVLVVLVGGLAAYARTQQQAALSGDIAATADLLLSSDPALAAQLAAIAYDVAPTAEARSSLLDVYAGPTTTRILSPTGFPQSVAVTADSTLLATGGADDADTDVRLWSLRDRLRPRLLGDPLPGHSDAIYGLAFSPNGRLLVSGGRDKTIRIWDVADPEHPVPIGAAPVEQPAAVFRVAFSADGRTLAVGGADGAVRLYDLSDSSATQLLGKPLAGPAGDIRALAFSPTNPLLAAGSDDGTVHLWDVSDPRNPVSLGSPWTDLGPVLHLAFSPDGRALAFGGGRKTVHLWDVADPDSPRPLGDPLIGPGGLVNHLAFALDGQSVAAASSDNKVWLWDVSTGAITLSLPHPGPATYVRFLDDATLASSATDGAVRIWAIPGPTISEPSDIVFTAEIGGRDDRVLILGWDGTDNEIDGRIRLYDISDRRRPLPLGPPFSAPTGSGLSGAAGLSSDGRLVAGGALDGTVFLWDATAQDGPVLVAPPLIESTKNIQSVEFSPDGRALAVAGDDAAVRLYSVTNPRQPILEATLPGGGVVFATAFSADGRLLAAASGDERAWIWDITDKARPTLISNPLSGHTGEVYSIAFAGDDRTLATGGADRTVRLWDVSDPATPTPLDPPLVGPNNTVYWLTFSANSRYLAAGGGDGTIWIWDVTDSTRPVYAILTALPDAIWSVSFSGDGRTLAAGGAGTTGQLWSIDPNEVRNAICATAGDAITPAEWARYINNLDYHPPCA